MSSIQSPDGRPPDVLDLVTLGESMLLLVAEQAGPLGEATSFRRHVAGAESNVAIGLVRLGHTAGWISRLGDDDFGRAVLLRIRGEGVDTSRVVLDATAPTGVFFREQHTSPDRPIEVVYYRRGSAASRLGVVDLDAGYIGSARFLHLTGITPALSATCREAVFAAVEIARASGVSVAFDPNYRSKLWAPDEARRVLGDLASRCDIVLPGLDEAQLLTGESDAETAARRLHLAGGGQTRMVVVKLGARGALAITADQVVHAPARALQRIVDPVGAGDAFAAGLLAGLLRDMQIDAALDLANRCGAFAMTGPGDMEALPRWEDVAGPASGLDVRR
jgi:2-dehydro-3-deoxygluconokinase